jgi:hypothetical protein
VSTPPSKFLLIVRSDAQRRVSNDEEKRPAANRRRPSSFEAASRRLRIGAEALSRSHTA